MTPAFIGVFTITKYGISGNELPPPPVKSWSRAIYSFDGEEILDFIERCNKEGIGIRKTLDAETAEAYSCPDSISWKVYIAGTLGELMTIRKNQ